MLPFPVLGCLAVLSLARALPLLQDTREGVSETSNTNSSSTDCPTWYIPSTKDQNRCMCGDSLMNAIGKVVECHGDQRVSVLINYCMSYNEDIQQMLVAECPYVNALNKTTTQPQNQSDLNGKLCEWADREGFMCHKCKDGLGISVFNYEYKCVKCLGKLKGCLFLVTIPTTVFFILVVTCRIQSTTANMNGMICILQMWNMFVDRHPRACSTGDRLNCGLLLATLTIGRMISCRHFVSLLASVH